MEQTWFERLGEVMQHMAAGDRAAPFTLYYEFGAHIRNVMRRELRRVGLATVDPDDLEGLVLDACLELFECAGSWRPDGGALPWNWARRRLNRVVAGFVGQHTQALVWGEGVETVVADPAPRATAGFEPAEVEVLDTLAEREPAARLFKEALGQVASPRYQQLLLGVEVQVSMGDPAPADTVARLHGTNAPAVRQACKRTRDRLRAMVAGEPSFAGLTQVAFLR